MKIKYILIFVVLALAGLTVWYQEPDSNTQTKTIALSPSKPALENRKVTSKDGSMTVIGGIRVEIDPGTTTTEVPENDPHWKAAYEEAKKQRENLAEK